MRKKYDDFTQLKVKDMSKYISDMTYKYINPTTGIPTSVPPLHYEKILNQIQEQYLGEITARQFLTIMHNQLSALKKEDEKYFNQALLCLDLGINPKDLRMNEQISLMYTYDYMEDKQKIEKKNFHFLNDDIVNTYNNSLDDPNLQSQVIRISNMLEEKDNNLSNDEWGDR